MLDLVPVIAPEVGALFACGVRVVFVYIWNGTVNRIVMDFASLKWRRNINIYVRLGLSLSHAGLVIIHFTILGLKYAHVCHFKLLFNRKKIW